MPYILKKTVIDHLDNGQKREHTFYFRKQMSFCTLCTGNKDEAAQFRTKAYATDMMRRIRWGSGEVEKVATTLQK